MCGSRTQSGHWYWCLSPACDRCRRYRARYVAESVADWSMSVVATHRIRSVDMTTRPCSDPETLLSEMDRVRIALRRSYSRHQRQDDRWATLAQYAAWTPLWGDGTWSARLQGIVYLGSVREIQWTDEIGGLTGATLQPLSSCVLRDDVRDQMIRAMSATYGVKACDQQSLSAVYSAIDARGGYKPLLCRRGLQA